MSVINLDFETRKISSKEISPTPVCLGVWEDSKGKIHVKDKMRYWFGKYLKNKNNTLVFHNAKFDMGVAWVHFPELKREIWDAYTEGRIKCTQIRERLWTLSTLGNLTQARGYFSLAGSVERRLCIDLSEWKEGDDIWRLRYEELEDKPLEEWPSEAKEYVISDVENGDKLYHIQEANRTKEGIGSIGGEALQTATDFALYLPTIRGIKVDPDHIAAIAPEIEEGFMKGAQILMEEGIRDNKRYKKTGKAKQFRKEHRTGRNYKDCPEDSDYYLVPFFRPYAYEKKCGKISLEEKLLRNYIGERYPNDIMYSEKTGEPSLKLESLELIHAPDDVVVQGLKDLKEWQKLLTSFLPRLKAAAELGTIHPQYTSLMETGRTSSSGSTFYPSHNIQQMPKKGNIREAHIPRQGKKIGAFDYDSLELRSFAQQCYDLFGVSVMLELINKGMDVHAWMGAKLLSMDIGREVSYDEMMEMLDGKHGDVAEEQAGHFRQMAKAANFGFPGGLGAAKFLDYLKSYGITGVDLEQSKRIRKAFYDAFPEMDLFFDWHRIEEDCQGLWHYDTLGRWRANCDYKQAANGILLQSLASDGAKIALLRLTFECEFGRLEGTNLLAFIHDEFIFEIPEELTEKHGKIIMEIMVDSMQVVIPNVSIGVGGDIMPRWTKKKKDFLASWSFSKGAKIKEAA